MKKVPIFITIFFVVSVLPCAALATDDTDIYDMAEGAEPNVLIIFDNSGSMDTDVPYDDSSEYCSGAGCPYETDTIYRRQCLRWRRGRCRQWSAWEVYTDTFTDDNENGIHDSDTNIRKGNRLNYDTGDYGTRLAVAKLAVKDIITQSKDDVRFGIMVLNGAIDINDDFDDYLDYQTDTTVLSTDEGGAEIMDRSDEEIEDLIDDIEGMVADGGTPLANRLINAAQYFRGDFGSYSSPLDATYWCRTNFVIIMTDGKPEGEGDYRNFGGGTRWANYDGEYEHIEDFLDDNPESRDVDSDSKDPDPTDDYSNGGSDYLDDVAKYLHDVEDSVDPKPSGVPIEGNQNLTIYTIGFEVDHQLLQDTADNGGGTYQTTNDYQQLLFALETVMESIVDRAQTFTAPVVPVHRTTSGTDMYVSLFTPKSQQNFWPGYLIKLGIGDEGKLMGYSDDYGADGGTTEVVVADDVTGELDVDLIDSDSDPYPYWDAHNTLKNRASARNIYTYLGTTNDLNDASGDNAFTTGNTTYLTAAVLGNPTEGSNPREDLINYMHGADAYDDDVDSDYTEKRDNILGDILHSQPLAIDYSSTERVIFVGTNDGMLHAFDDTDGSELWAFIPPDLLPLLKDIVEGSGHQYFVD